MAFKMDAADTEDLEKFIQQVESLEEIVKGFKSTDLDEQNEAMEKADKMLEEKSSVVNRTVINKEAFRDDIPSPGMNFSNPETSQNEFLRALKADADTRAEARRKRQEKANRLKERANEVFRSGDFEVAVKLYADAIATCKDITPLYTNRAMAYMKLGRYIEAIEDCEMAKRVDITWAKAYILKGNAFRALKKYKEAIDSYKEMLEHHPEKEKLVEGYVRETEEEEKAEALEVVARRGLEEKEPASNLVSTLIHTLGTRVEPKCETKEITFSCYAATLKMLAGQIQDDLPAQVLFRQEGGFKILTAKPYLRDVLMQQHFEFSQQSDFARNMLVTIQAACSKCPQNTIAFFQEPFMMQVMLNLLDSKDKQVKHAAIVCFFEFAANDKMIELVTDLFTVPSILRGLLSADVIKLKLLHEAILTLNRYAHNEKFRLLSEPCFHDLVLKVYHQFIDEIGHNQRKELPMCIHNICIFLKNLFIRGIVATDRSFWDSCVTCIDKIIQVLEPNNYREEMLSNMLDVTEFMLLYFCDENTRISPKLATALLPALNWKSEMIVKKTLTTLTRCIERSKETILCFDSTSGLVFIKKIYKSIKSENPSVRTFALKIIAYCGQTRVSVLRNIPKIDKRYNTLRKVLSMDESEIDNLNQAHAAISFGFLSQLPGGMDPLLEYGEDAANVVKYMLELARNGKTEQIRNNCVIALGKMASNDGRILGELRRFDGINILSKNKPTNI